MTFAGNQRFQILRELGRGGMGVVYEAFDSERNQPVALKMLHRNDPETIVRLKQEFRSLSEIAHPHLIGMYELLGDDQHWCFTMEFVRDGRNFMEHLHTQMGMVNEVVAQPAGGLDAGQHAEKTLPDSNAAPTLTAEVADRTERTALRAEPADLTEATIADLATALEPARQDTKLQAPQRILTPDQIHPIMEGFRQLAEGLTGLHAQGILHRDLKPGNVMVRSDGSIVILDFGLAVAKERDARRHVSGTDRSTSGSSSGSSGWITGTIAYMAPEQAAGLPLTEASDWYAVGTMLFEALTGERPFEGPATAILHVKQVNNAPDVNSCVSGIPPELASLCNGLLARDPAIRPNGAAVLKILGEGRDAEHSGLLESEDTVPFIGRAEYIERLNAAFTRSHMMALVAHLRGRSGTGKSALMTEFVRQLGEREQVVVFRSRCYEQESVPYKTVDGLADEIAQWLMQHVETRRRTYLPSATSALAQIFPVFRRVPCISRAPAAVDQAADLEELRRQSFDAFGELLQRIGNAHPLVLCIDDLQWGDVDGMEMLAVALARPSIRLMLIVTFREEYAETSLCLRALRNFEAASPSVAMEDIAVKPLTREESLDLAQRRNPNTTSEDLEEIVRQAEGNPYFLEELAYHAGGAKKISPGRGLELDSILWSRVERLSSSELRLLETVAVSGQPIRLLHAQKAAGLEAMPVSVLTSLRMHHFVRSSGSRLQDEVETYHDRIRETVLDHLSGDTRRERHASLAICLESSGEATPDTLAVHFEAGEQPERAGHFYELAAQDAARALTFTRAEDFYKRARRLVSDPVAHTRITQRLIHLNADLAKFPEAYALGREALAELGMKVPAKFRPPDFLCDLGRFWLLFRNRKVASILDLPAATDAQHIARITLLAAIGKAAYQIRPELCIAIMLKIVNASVRLGNTPDSAIGYMAVGTIFVGGILGRYRAGYEFGQASLKLVGLYVATRIRAEVHFVVGYFGTSWRRPANEAEELWKVARAAGMESGDLFHMGCATCATIMSQFMRGVPFEQLEPLTEESLDLLNRYGLREPHSAVMAVQQMIRILRDPAMRIPHAKATAQPAFGSRHIAHYAFLLRMQEQYLFGEYAATLETGKISAQYLGDSRGMLHGTEHVFYLALASLALLRHRPIPARIPALARLHRKLRRFERWAEGSPINFAAKMLVLRGEFLSVSGKPEMALTTFAQAARTAVDDDQPHIAGLSHRLAAAELGRQGDHTRCMEHMQLSAEHYRRWGAHGFAELLPNGVDHELYIRNVSA